MAVNFNSYLHFAGTTRQALEYYKSVFGGEVSLSTFAQYETPEMPVADEDRDKIMHGYFKGENGVEFMASDAPMGMTVGEGGQVSLALSGDDEAVLREYWDKLSDGAVVTVPLNLSPWGDTFGMLTDRFGVEWMVDIGPAQDDQESYAAPAA